jgi:hypothetical protein
VLPSAAVLLDDARVSASSRSVDRRRGRSDGRARGLVWRGEWEANQALADGTDERVVAAMRLVPSSGLDATALIRVAGQVRGDVA